MLFEILWSSKLYLELAKEKEKGICNIARASPFGFISDFEEADFVSGATSFNNA